MSINKVIFCGNLTRDAEVRETQSGMDVVRFSVAVNDRQKNQRTGEWEDRANYIDCVAFGERWTKLSNYLTKGTKVTVEGKLRWSKWEQDGQKRSKLEIVPDNVEFMAKKEDKPSQGSLYDEDIPF